MYKPIYLLHIARFVMFLFLFLLSQLTTNTKSVLHMFLAMKNTVSCCQLIIFAPLPSQNGRLQQPFASVSKRSQDINC